MNRERRPVLSIKSLSKEHLLFLKLQREVARHKSHRRMAEAERT